MAEFQGLETLGQISMPVRELAKAIEFYRDVLGLPFLFEVPGMAFFQCGEIRLLLAEPEEGDFENSNSILYFKVEDIEGALGALRRLGAEVISPAHLVAPMTDHDLWMAFFKDSEGNTLALMEEVMR